MNSGWTDPMAIATREFEAGKFDAALAALEAAEKSENWKAPAQDLRGSIYLEQQKWSEAAAAFEMAHATAPSFLSPRLHGADLLLRQGKWEEARARYFEVMEETNVLIAHEQLRFGALLASIAGKDEAAASAALERLPFPTESPAYYYGQAAWSYAHGNRSAGDKWLRTAQEVFDARQTAWFARKLYDVGWIKKKPPLVVETL
ncbi:MAG: tetratricopeptide repeat protein [Chthoniobacterales bacterium]